MHTPLIGIEQEYALNGKPIFVVNRIVSKITGLNQAMLQRARLISNYTNQRVAIVSFYYDPRHYNTLQEKLILDGKIDSSVDIINMYEYFKGEKFEEIEFIEKPNYDGYFIEKKKNALRYFLNGNYIKYEKYTEDGYLERADYYDNNRYNYKSEEYDQKGNVVKVLYKDLISGQPRNEMYYRSDGTVFMSKWYQQNYESKKNKVIRINIFDENNNIKKVVYSENELKHYFLDCIVNNKKSVLLAEARSVDNLIINYKNEKVRKAAIVHNMHLEPPFNDESEIDSSHQVLLSNVDNFDAVVILTNKQKEDIEDKIGEQNNFHVIPHANRIRPKKKAIDPSNEKNRIVIVARLAKQKQLDHAIKAMDQVVKELPNTSLHIFGDGKEREKLTRLIYNLNLRENVFLEGYTNDPISEYLNADLSLLTSEYEGFGLVILESLSQSCPVISYDLKYGPSDMIINGENGFLVEYQNVNLLSEKIIEVLKNKDLLSRLSEGAYTSIERFDEETFVKRWIEMFNSLLAD